MLDNKCEAVKSQGDYQEFLFDLESETQIQSEPVSLNSINVE